jgi:hypothetical protein
MFELSSPNLDVLSAEVAYRHHLSHGAQSVDLRDLPRVHWWSRRGRRSGAHAG